MDDSSVEWNTELKLSQPTLADGEIHFSAFGPGWGFCSYAVPAGVAMQCLEVPPIVGMTERYPLAEYWQVVEH
jgi:hypothetical protein